MRRAFNVVALLLAAMSLRAQATWKASVDANGLPGNGAVGFIAISGDGNVVAFDSLASNVVANDTNGVRDVFVRDLRTGAVERASRALGGGASDGASQNATLSFDGRFVVFESDATNLVASDGNGARDVFVLDRSSGSITRASTPYAGGDADGASQNASISADGARVAFESWATNLRGSVPLGVRQVWMFDSASAALDLASRSSASVPGDGDSRDAKLSADGRFVVFASHASNLVPFDTNSNSDVFVRDLALNTTERVSLITDGSQSQGFFQNPTISGNGRITAFVSLAPDLVGNDTNLAFDVFVHDAVTGQTTRESVSSAGSQGSLSSYKPELSLDGRTLVFQSFAPDLVHGDTNGVSDIFVRDLVLGITTRIGLATNGAQGDGHTFLPRISDGTGRIAFHSEAGTLAPGDVNGESDMFVHDRGAQPLRVDVYCAAKTNSLGCTPAIGASGLPRASGDDAFFVTAARVRPGLAGMLVWSFGSASIPFGGGTLCVAPPLRRTPVQSAGANGPSDVCTGTYSFRFTHLYRAANGLGPGATVHCQFWSRDPGFPLPDAIGLTDALIFTITP